METSGDSSPCVSGTPKLLTQLQELEPRLLRRRLSQARHRATLVRLFNSLRKTVFSHSNSKTTKWQVLRKAKTHIQELEKTLDNLLKMKESLNLEDGKASTLEEVKAEYAMMYFNNHSTTSEAMGENGETIWYLIQELDREAVEEEGERRDEFSHSSSVTSSPDLLEFERYLYFYKQTVDLLIQNGIISLEQVSLPIVSTVISHLWQELPEEKRERILQACVQRQRSFVNAKAPCQEPECLAEDSVKDSGVGSQEANESLVSTPEEILFEDAFDVATGVSSPSSVCAGCSSENPEENNHLYVQIISFFKGLFCANTQLPQKLVTEDQREWTLETEIQKEAIPLDDETVMLRCTETFDEDI